MPGSASTVRVGKKVASAPAEPELFNQVSVGRISEVIVEQIRLLVRRGQQEHERFIAAIRRCDADEASHPMRGT